jgi:hypothetical protein
VGSGTISTHRASATRITSIHSPPKTADHRLRAPAAMLIAVVLTDPPTGMPWNRPATRLPAPWPMKSRLVDEGEPSGLGADSATPAPCTRMIAAIAAAPAIRSTLSRVGQGGRVMGGNPVGIAPMSSTVRTSSRPARATTAVVTTTAIRVPNSRSGVRPSSIIAASAPTPTRAEATVISCRLAAT